MLRSIWGALSFMAAAACTKHEWLPPPEAAVSSCAYEIDSTDFDVPSSTLWYDSSDHVIQVDGRYYDGNAFYRASYEFSYDDLGRLTEERAPDYTVRYEYTAEQIVERIDDVTWTDDLIDGRIVHEQSSLGSTRDYTYDASGRVASYASFDAGDTRSYLRQYTYDSEGRVASIDNQGLPLRTVTYAWTGQQLLISFDGDPYKPQGLALDFDENERLVRSSVISSDGVERSVSTFDYGDGVSEEHYGEFTVRATGRCDNPSVPTARRPPLPIEWTADYVTFQNRARIEMFIAF
jgi:YD repeat-containing protein